jgi:hypothetical protein
MATKKYNWPELGDKFGNLIVIEIYQDFKNNKPNGKRIRLVCNCGAVLSNKTAAQLYSKDKPLLGCAPCRSKSRGIKNRKTDNSQAKNAVFFNYRNAALRRNFEWNLDKETFFKYIQKSCVYCNSSNLSYFNPPKTSPWSEQFRYTGLDRINSELGYTVENIQPCCKWCNMAKSDRSEKDFIEWVALIIDNWGKVF